MSAGLHVKLGSVGRCDRQAQVPNKNRGKVLGLTHSASAEPVEVFEVLRSLLLSSYLSK